MQRTVATWEEFRQVWDGVLNFLMVGECVPFSFDMPPVEQVIDEIRRDPDARIWRGARGDSLDQTDISEAFRKLPLQQAVDAQFQMSHFKLSNFYAPGRLFHCFEAQVLDLWRRALADAGFTLDALLSHYFHQRPPLRHQLPHGPLTRPGLAASRGQALRGPQRPPPLGPG